MKEKATIAIIGTLLVSGIAVLSQNELFSNRQMEEVSEPVVTNCESGQEFKQETKTTTLTLNDCSQMVITQDDIDNILGDVEEKEMRINESIKEFFGQDCEIDLDENGQAEELTCYSSR